MPNYYWNTFSRSWLKNRSVFLLHFLGLTLGFSCFLFTFLFVHYERNYDSLTAGRDRICRMGTDVRSGGVETRAALVYGFLADPLARQFPEIEQVIRFHPFDGKTGLRWKATDPLIKVQRLYYSDSSALTTFGWHVQTGDARRCLTAPNSIVLTNRLSRRIFGRTAALGQTLTLNGKPLSVTAIVEDPPGNISQPWDALISFSTLSEDDAKDWTYLYLLFHSAAAARAFPPRLDSFARTVINPELGFNPHIDLKFIFFLQPLPDVHFSDFLERDTPKGNRVYVNIFLVTGILILLIAFTNSINLSIVQSFSRIGDVTIRKIYGASPVQLVGRELTVSLLVGSLALGLSFLLAAWLLPAFASLVNRDMTMTDLFNGKVLAAAIISLAVLGTGSALYTAVYLRRVQPADTLRSRQHKMRGLQTLPRLMLGLQFFIAIGMGTVALSVYRQVRYFQETPLGFSADNVLIVNLPQEDAAVSGIRYLQRELGRDPDISLIAGCAESGLPGGNVDIDLMTYREQGVKVHKTIYHIDVDDHYLPLLKIPLIRGHGFNPIPDTAAANSAIVTSSFARKAGWSDPIGETIVWGNHRIQVIGVVPDFHYRSLHQAITPMVIFQQSGSSEELLLRVSPVRTAAVLQRLQAIWKRTFPETPLYYSFLDEQLAQQYRDESGLLRLLLTLTIGMIVVSAIGLIAYLSFLLRLARTGIAIRRVIGAKFGDIYVLFARPFLLLLLIAVAGAGPLAWWCVHSWLQQFAYHVRPQLTDLFIALACVAAGVALLVANVAVRGIRANPARSLRED